MTDGWRFWLVWPGTDLLIGPYKYSDGPGSPPGYAPWPATVQRAICSFDPSHRAPARGCTCGVYADPSYEAVCARASYHKTAFAWRGLAIAAGQPQTTLAAYVAGRVQLEGAVPFNSPILRKYHDEGELRAASATILELNILSGPSFRDLGKLLARRYRIPVYA